MDDIRPWLVIGNYRDTLNSKLLARKSIDAMLQLAEKVEQPNIIFLFLPVEDFAPLQPTLLRQGVDFIRYQKQEGRRILVACSAGISRSSSFCTAALKEEEGLSLFEAFKQVKHKHPDSLPHESVWESLCSYFKENTPYLEVLRLGSSIG